MRLMIDSDLSVRHCMALVSNPSAILWIMSCTPCISIQIDLGAEIFTTAPDYHFFVLLAPVMRSWTVPSILRRVASFRSCQKTFKCWAMNSSLVSLLAGSLRNVTLSYFNIVVTLLRYLRFQPQAAPWALLVWALPMSRRTS